MERGVDNSGRSRILLVGMGVEKFWGKNEGFGGCFRGILEGYLGPFLGGFQGYFWSNIFWIKF